MIHWLQFLLYFLVVLAIFFGFWKGLDRAFNALEDRQDRRFEEKVDRYRRGHR